MEIYTTLRQINKENPSPSERTNLLKVIGDDYHPDWPIYAFDLLKNSLPLDNLFWIICTAFKKQDIDAKWFLLPLACDCIERELPIFESIYPKESYPKDMLALTREIVSQKHLRDTDESRRRVEELLQASEMPIVKLNTRVNNLVGGLQSTGALSVILRVSLKVARFSRSVLELCTGVVNDTTTHNNYIPHIIQELARPATERRAYDMHVVGTGGEIKWVKSSEIASKTREFIKENESWIRGRLEEYILKYEDEGAENA